MGEEELSVSHRQRITTSELSHPEIEEKSTNHLSRRQVEEMDNRRSSEIVVDVQRTTNCLMMTMTRILIQTQSTIRNLTRLRRKLRL